MQPIYCYIYMDIGFPQFFPQNNFPLANTAEIEPHNELKYALGNWDHFVPSMYCSIDLTFLERLCKCSFARRGTGICQTALFISFFFFNDYISCNLFSTWDRMYGLHILIPYIVLENKETVLACCVTRKSPILFL